MSLPLSAQRPFCALCKCVLFVIWGAGEDVVTHQPALHYSGTSEITTNSLQIK